ncbi:hypothetical protein H920_17023 [Fukomys damarensis]|uniref:Uncharacterized protein n=1 Tax=Fukomys damarensis TaxID=885580 RepID=A0A091CUB4_FUKDA|nr:hypothetical protein H920_17023 [Fukomys damarensis]
MPGDHTTSLSQSPACIMPSPTQLLAQYHFKTLVKLEANQSGGLSTHQEKHLAASPDRKPPGNQIGGPARLSSIPKQRALSSWTHRHFRKKKGNPKYPASTPQKHQSTSTHSPAVPGSSQGAQQPTEGNSWVAHPEELSLLRLPRNSWAAVGLYPIHYSPKKKQLGTLF